MAVEVGRLRLVEVIANDEILLDIAATRQIPADEPFPLETEPDSEPERQPGHRVARHPQLPGDKRQGDEKQRPEDARPAKRAARPARTDRK